jgi:probable rRNA maturation factor
MTRRAVRSIDLVVESAAWKTLSPAARARLKKAALRTLEREKAKGHFTLLLTGDARVKAMNALFRGKNKPTNVLSFPAEENAERYLGDVAIAHGVVRREAKEAGKHFADHLIHLTVHGVLHLLGHDHMKPREAARMEGLEREILAEFGIPDPYAPILAKSLRKPAKRHV